MYLVTLVNTAELVKITVPMRRPPSFRLVGVEPPTPINSLDTRRLSSIEVNGGVAIGIKYIGLKLKKEADLLNLYKKVDATSKMRFHSSRRLKLHTRLSTATIVFISLVLILIALMQAYSLGVNIHSRHLALIQVFSSITVLVYSLLIDKNGFSSLSERMYSCASRLGELKQKMYPFLESGTPEQYAGFRDEYHEILKLYEAAAINDFNADYMRAQLDMPENYKFSLHVKAWLKTKVAFMYILNFSQYFVILVIFGWLLYWLWFGPAVIT
ncbi:SLATT domain-containing protein [Nitrosospira sp. Nsp2]|uniref:SLATT domain-containing protein n=1 Tax=Nitrosospira sp. Nsp2 TaxID=136548 RepID=UPI001C629047|nr:SLATT domain-containing protein [Nitrosospira sp. Nsp2]